MTVTRELSMVYGSVTVGGASAATYNIDGYPRYSEERGLDAITATVSFDVIVVGTSAANLETSVTALTDEFVTPFQRFRWIEAGTTFLDWNPATDSGFNASPAIELLGGIPDTGRTRKYRCSVSVGLPADNNNGRISSTYQVAYSKSDLRTVTVTGTYTAQGGTGAFDNAQTKLPTYAASILSGLGGTYEILGTGTYETDDQDKVSTGTVIYKEILYDQSAAGADLTSVVDHGVIFRRTSTAPGDTPGGYLTAARIVTAEGAYAASVDFGETTDLKTLWTGTLRQYVLDQAKTNLGLTEITIVEDTPVYNKSENTISCRLSIWAIPDAGAGGAFEYRVTQSVRNIPGALVRRVWNGNPFGAVVYEGPRSSIRTTIIRAILTAAKGVNTPAWAPGKLATGFGERNTGANKDNKAQTNGWIVLEDDESHSPVQYGLPALNGTIDATEYTRTVREEWIEAGDGGGSSDLPGPSSRPDRQAASTFTPRVGASGSGGDSSLVNARVT